MKIIELQAENIKRLAAVEIKPDGNVVEITGRNGSGKTSVLDSIWWALTGKDSIQAEPIRNGEQQARIQVDLGELIVTRTFKRKGDTDYTTALTVVDADGGKLKSPQTILDALVGELTFDPLEFTRLRPREQFDQLKGFVPGIDFDELEAADRRDYEARTEINREIKRLQAQADAITVDPHLPFEPVDESEIVRQAEAANQAQRLADERDRLRAQANDLRRQARDLDNQAADLEDEINSLDAIAGDDAADLTERLRNAREINAAIAERDRKNQLRSEWQKLTEQSEQLTNTMRARAEEKQRAITEAEMPVSGIGFGDGEILLNDVPFNQASDAEQLSTSVAIAMAMNPRLRVIRIRDGSLLDDESMARLVQLATDRDYQVWIETVSAGKPGAVVIENGTVKDSDGAA
jgi:DNA repair exonuclease SbcCD ATPase subunit